MNSRTCIIVIIVLGVSMYTILVGNWMIRNNIDDDYQPNPVVSSKTTVPTTTTPITNSSTDDSNDEAAMTLLVESSTEPTNNDDDDNDDMEAMTSNAPTPVAVVRTTPAVKSKPYWFDNNYTGFELQEKAFPRWDEPNGISIETILTFLQERIDNEYVSTITSKKRRKMYAELLYIVDQDGIYYSQVLHNRTDLLFRGFRGTPMEYIMKLSYQRLKRTSAKRYKRLRQVVMEQGGLPFFVFIGDYSGCCYNNLIRTNVLTQLHEQELQQQLQPNQRRKKIPQIDVSSHEGDRISLPIFTLAAKLNCHHSFPMPTYRTIYDSKNSSSAWDDEMKQWSQQYPMSQKIRKVFWRGGLTGQLENFTSPRWRLPEYVTQVSNGNTTIANMFDIGIHNIPGRHNRVKLNLTKIGGIREGIFPKQAFQKYIAILDIDGNSWSSRFGLLLCYNSVIMKVDAHYVDYFYINPTKHKLIPWKHYIPVKYDLSDLVEQTEYIINRRNAKNITNIIRNANSWCRARMTQSSLVDDFLDIWSSYVSLLDKNDTNWTSLFQREKLKHGIYTNQSKYGMTLSQAKTERTSDLTTSK